MKLNHYLLTFVVGPSINAHAYIMCPKKESKDLIERSCNRLFVELEQQFGIKNFLPMILVTDLGYKIDADVQRLRNIVRQGIPKDTPSFEDAKDFHLSAWIMHDDNPDNKFLMALH